MNLFKSCRFKLFFSSEADRVEMLLVVLRKRECKCKHIFNLNRLRHFGGIPHINTICFLYNEITKWNIAALLSHDLEIQVFSVHINQLRLFVSKNRDKTHKLSCFAGRGMESPICLT